MCTYLLKKQTELRINSSKAVTSLQTVLQLHLWLELLMYRILNIFFRRYSKYTEVCRHQSVLMVDRLKPSDSRELTSNCHIFTYFNCAKKNNIFLLLLILSWKFSFKLTFVTHLFIHLYYDQFSFLIVDFLAALIYLLKVFYSFQGSFSYIKLKCKKLRIESSH